MSARIGAVLPLICLLVLPAAASAQQRVALFTDPHPAIVADEVASASLVHMPVQEPSQGMEMKPEEQMSTSGFFLGLVSMIAGAAIGSSIGESNCPSKDVDKDCLSRHGYTGALIAGSTMIPIGVHIVAPHRHNLLPSLGLSALTGLVLWEGFSQVPGKPIAMAPFVALPLQVLTSVRLERTKKP
jgi:hypothetical protein